MRNSWEQERNDRERDRERERNLIRQQGETKRRESTGTKHDNTIHDRFSGLFFLILSVIVEVYL
jgi:hypothetical protein